MVEDLIGFRLGRIKSYIAKILERWSETDASVFLKKAKDGTYSEVESDAVMLRQLLLDEKRLERLCDTL